MSIYAEELGFHYINGQFRSGHGPALISKNPFNNEPIWSGHLGTIEEVAEASMLSHTAFKPWSKLTFEERAVYCQKFATLVEEKKEALASIISLETGKPLWESLTEVSAVIAKVSISIDAYKKRTSLQHISTPDAQGFLRFKPLGVMVVLGPFNFPAHLSNGHIVPALLAGNTILYKPSELTPKVAQFIMRCWHETGLPPGVIQCIQGDVRTATHLLNRDIQGVLFTGSYRGGLSIHHKMMMRPDVLLALEMGGNNPLLIGQTDNVKAAVYMTLMSAFISAGQRCSCARRLWIPNNKTGEIFLEHLKKATQQLKYGAYTDSPEPFMGPVISDYHARMHLEAQEKLIELGATPIIKMKKQRRSKALLSPGLIEMTGIDSPPDEEIFAPLLQVYRYDTFEQAIQEANQTRFGLAAGLLSDDKHQYEYFLENIRAGIVNWNRPLTGASSSLPFGGIGSSGNYRPSAYYAADYCAYPVSSLEQTTLTLPEKQSPGIHLE